MNLSQQQIETIGQQIGAKTARHLFNKRGNHSEIHLAELELAAIIRATVQVTLEAVKESFP